MSAVRSVVVVGAGVAGLSAALACARAGIATTLIDRVPPGQEGSAIGVQGQALAVLDDFGLGAAARRLAQPLSGRFARNIEMVGLYRPVLVDLLAQAAAAAGVDCRYGQGVAAVDPATGCVTLDDGSTMEAELVVAADGIRSRLRETVLGAPVEPAYAGQMHLRLIAKGPHLPDPPPMLVQDWGKYLGYPLPGELTYAIIVLNRETPERIPDEEAKRVFVESMRRFDNAYVQALAARVGPDDVIRARPFEWLLVPGDWYRDRMLLIGDAAHATTAHMSYGGGLGLEDGAVLGKVLRESTTLEEALADFMRRRRDRVATVVRASVALSRGEQGVDVGDHERGLIPRAFALVGVPYAEPAPPVDAPA